MRNFRNEKCGWDEVPTPAPGGWNGQEQLGAYPPAGPMMIPVPVPVPRLRSRLLVEHTAPAKLFATLLLLLRPSGKREEGIRQEDACNGGETFRNADPCRMARHTSAVTFSDSVISRHGLNCILAKIRKKIVKIYKKFSSIQAKFTNFFFQRDGLEREIGKKYLLEKRPNKLVEHSGKIRKNRKF